MKLPHVGKTSKVMAHGKCRSQCHKEGFFCIANYIISIKACYSSLSYHWFLLINQILPSCEISCLCINCNFLFLNLIKDWDPVGSFYLFVMTCCWPTCCFDTSSLFGFWLILGFSPPPTPRVGKMQRWYRFRACVIVLGLDMRHGSNVDAFHVVTLLERNWAHRVYWR